MRRVIYLCIFFLAIGCISKSKYVQLLENRNRTEEARIRLEQELAGSQAAIDNLKTSATETRQIQQQFEEVQTQNVELQKEHRRMQNELETLKEQNTQMQAKIQAAAVGAQSDNNAPQWEQLERAIDKQKRSYQRLKGEISNNFIDLLASNQIQISEKNASLYISLSQDLLFSKGNDLMEPQGISAITKLTPILTKEAQTQVIVQGHTDNDGAAKYNWTLSTRRALSVVEVMMNAGLNGERITASGRALFDPIAPNTSSENKAKNRRIEIIVHSNMERILSILN